MTKLDLYPQHSPIKVAALVAIGIDNTVALLKAKPKRWWEELLMGDTFWDIGPQNLPKEPGLYWFHGHFVPNRTAGKALPNGEIDDYPGEWIGGWTQEQAYADNEARQAREVFEQETASMEQFGPKIARNFPPPAKVDDEELHEAVTEGKAWRDAVDHITAQMEVRGEASLEANQVSLSVEKPSTEAEELNETASVPTPEEIRAALRKAGEKLRRAAKAPKGPAVDPKIRFK